MKDNFSNVPDILKKNMSALIMEIEKYRIAKQDRHANSEQTSKTGYSPNAPYNNVFGLSGYVSQLSKDNMLQKEEFDGNLCAYIKEPNEELKSYPLYVQCNDDSTFNYSGENNETVPQFNVFTLDIQGTYTEPAHGGYVNVVITPELEDISDENGTRIYIPENPNKPILSLLYESFKTLTDSKQPQYKDVPKFLVFGKPLGYLIYFLAQLFNITTDKNYDKLPANKKPKRPKFICTPLKHYTKEELTSFIASVNPKQIQGYLKEFRQEYNAANTENKIPLLNFNLDENSIIRHFFFEDRSALNLFDIEQENSPTVLDQNTPKNMKKRKIHAQTNEEIENKRVDELEQDRKQREYNKNHVLPDSTSKKGKLSDKNKEFILKNTPKENLDNITTILNQIFSDRIKFKNDINALNSIDLNTIATIIPEELFSIHSYDEFSNRIKFLANIGRTFSRAGIDYSEIIKYIDADTMKQWMSDSSRSVAKITEKINNILVERRNKIKYPDPSTQEKLNPSENKKDQTPSLSSRLGIRSLLKK